MNLLFLVYLIVEALFGLGFLFFPSLVMGPMGVTLDATATSLAMMLGSVLISFSVLFFFARKSDNLEFKKGAIYCAVVYLFISTIVLLIGQLKGLTNASGWGIVILHLIFLVWFAYYALQKEKKAA